MYVSIDLSANLRLGSVFLQYITRVFLDKVNISLSSYKDSLFSWQFSGGNKLSAAKETLGGVGRWSEHGGRPQQPLPSPGTALACCSLEATAGEAAPNLQLFQVFR